MLIVDQFGGDGFVSTETSACVSWISIRLMVGKKKRGPYSLESMLLYVSDGSRSLQVENR